VVNALLPHPHVQVLFAAAALLAGLNSIQRPAIEAMTPQLVQPGELPAVSTLNSIRGNAAHIAGPGIAGWIAGAYGPAIAFGINAATYLGPIATLLSMSRKEFKGDEEGTLNGHSLSEGWRYAFERKTILGNLSA